MPERPESGREPAMTSTGGAVQSPSPASAPAHLSGTDAHLRHALRTPLNHIIGYTELLLEDARERGLEEMVSDLGNIHAAGQELLALINRLLDPQAVDTDSAILPDGEGMPTSIRMRDGASPADRVDPGQALGGRLLVVDDNEDNRTLVTRLLERAGYEVLSASDGAEALEHVKTQRPDLVLLDVMMPVMDGVEACHRLKDDPDTRLIPVVMMTALGQVEDRVRAIRAGADDFLTKPVNRDELIARIQTSLRLKRTVEDKVDRLTGTQEYLARFVPQSVLRELEANPDAPEVRKTEQDMSALFVDVSGYTRLSENLRQTADFIVEKYFSRYFDAIHARGGDVTETSGDGLMAIFPGSDPIEHAVNAVTAALDIMHRTSELNEQLRGIFEPIAVHMGINSGIALIGPTKYEGTSGARWVYTALGPAVNLAARIAGVAEAGTIGTGPETARRIEGRIATREIGRRQLKNVRDEIIIHLVDAGGG